MHFQANWIGVFESIGAQMPDARCWREDGIFYAVTGLDLSVFNVALLESTTELTPKRLERIEEQMVSLNIPYSIQLCAPIPTPGCITQLQTAGYTELFTDPLRWHEGPLAPIKLNPEIEVRPIKNQTERDIYKALVIRGFDLLDSAQEFIDVMLALNDGYHVIAWVGKLPVGAGSVLLCGAEAGVYNVATLPVMRRRGVGAAVMNALHNHALAQGFAGTALASSVMGLELYRHLGYSEDGYQIAYEGRC